MQKAGDRRTRLAIQRPADPAIVDAGNTPLECFDDVMSLWAKKQTLTAREFLAASQAQSEISGTLTFPRCLALKNINSAWRAIHVETGRILNFVGPFDPTDAGDEFKVLFTEAGSLGTRHLIRANSGQHFIATNKYRVHFLRSQG